MERSDVKPVEIVGKVPVRDVIITAVNEAGSSVTCIRVVHLFCQKIKYYSPFWRKRRGIPGWLRYQINRV